MITNKDKEYWLKQLEEFEADTGEQVKLEQDWFNIAAVSWDSKAFFYTTHPNEDPIKVIKKMKQTDNFQFAEISG